MTCQHCCGAESIFNRKSAERDAKRYRKKGPNKSTHLLLSALLDQGIEGMTLLDIGGGVGVIQHELLRKGLSSTTDVDASSAYISKAKEIMLENGLQDRMKFIHADFTDVEERVEKHDIVTLERVVCCYPDAEALLKSASGRSIRYLAFVYPRDTLLFRILFRLMDFYLWLRRNPFRTYMHSEELMFGTLREQHFTPVRTDRSGMWKMALFERR